MNFRAFIAQDATETDVNNAAWKYRDRSPGEFKAYVTRLGWNPGTVAWACRIHQKIYDSQFRQPTSGGPGGEDKDFVKFKKFEKT